MKMKIDGNQDEETLAEFLGEMEKTRDGEITRILISERASMIEWN